MDIDRRAVLAAAPAGFLGGGFDRVVLGKRAPPFTLQTFDGRKISLADMAGKVVALNFWAIWCTPCKVELPMFNVYVQKHPNPDLRLFAVTADDALPMAKLKELSAMVVFPLVKRLSASAYGPIQNELPTNFVIDRAGIVRYAEPGAFTDETFAAVVEPLLDEPAPQSAPSST